MRVRLCGGERLYRAGLKTLARRSSGVVVTGVKVRLYPPRPAPGPHNARPPCEATISPGEPKPPPAYARPPNGSLNGLGFKAELSEKTERDGRVELED